MVSDKMKENNITKAINNVLILVVMEYGLRHNGKKLKVIAREGLNPCCNGIWSQTLGLTMKTKFPVFVLILVVMEYGLRQA